MALQQLNIYKTRQRSWLTYNPKKTAFINQEAREKMGNFKKYFIKNITSNYPDSYNAIISDTEEHYRIISNDTAFAKTSKNPIDKRLDFSSYFLALIKTMDVREESFERIRKICLEITTDYVNPKNKLQAFIKRLIPKLTNNRLSQQLLKQLHRRVSKNENSNGFIANIITDKWETNGLGYGVDIIECGICKLFKKHNYHKYASILCEVDEITSGLAGLKLIRTGTIANGAKKCDFRFQRLTEI